MTRIWLEGRLIQVKCAANGLPDRFTWDGQTYRVAQITNEWEVNQLWWSGHIHRNYYKLTTQNGFLAIIYMDLLTDRWYLQRLFN